MSGSGGSWLIEALIASTLLMGFVLAVRRPAQRAFGPQLAYWLWALPALRMALPTVPATWREQTIAPIAAATDSVRVLILPVAAPADPAALPFVWLPLVAFAWLGGAALFFLWHGAAHFQYARRILAPPARHRRLADGTTLVESDAAAGPVAFGVLRRFVAVPRDFSARYDVDERRLALAHELGHHARGDLLANWIALAMLAMHWFNPVAWIAFRKFRTDQELANDARVLAALPAIDRHSYACAILKAAHGRAVTAACHLHTIDDLKGRLRMLQASRTSRRMAVAGATALVVLTIAGLGLTASGAAAEKIRSVAAVQVPVLAAQVVPATPAAPPGPVTPLIFPSDPHPSRHVVISDHGKIETYVGADADAYIAAHSELMVRPPLPPVPPVAGTAPVAPIPPTFTFVDDARAGTDESRDARYGPGAYAFTAPRVTEGDCGDRQRGSFVVRDVKDGQKQVIICKARIEQYTADKVQAGRARARAALTRALQRLDARRSAIANKRYLSEDDREQALAGIDEARSDLQDQLRDDSTD